MKRILSSCSLVSLIFCAIFLITGCNSKRYVENADKEVYELIDTRWDPNLGIQTNYKIDQAEEVNTPDINPHFDANTPLTLRDAVILATNENRNYKTQKENLYLSALQLTGVRHDYAVKWFGVFDAEYADSAADDSISASGSTGFSKLLKDGAVITTSLAIDWLRFLTGSPDATIGSVLSASITQPLLRGFGRDIVRERLVQSERNLLYEMRSFSRFRKDFVVSIVTDYYGVLQSKDAVNNALNDFNRRKESKQRIEWISDAGRKPKFEVDQTEQSLLAARDAYVAAQRRYEETLDRFKIRLAIPTDADIVLDQKELEALVQIGVDEPPFSVQAAVETALANRLDLATSADRINDAARQVAVAEDQLRTGLDIYAKAGVGSEETKDFNKLQFQDGDYAIGLEGDLPFDRLQERNNYRTALIELERSKREYELDIDNIKLEVRNSYGELVEAAQRYEIQKNSLALAEKRVESVKMLLEAGRAITRDLLEAQDALLEAQNNVTSALVIYTTTRLNFFKNIEMLEVKPDGMWDKTALSTQVNTGELDETKTIQ